jgi:hypothetical protein
MHSSCKPKQQSPPQFHDAVENSPPPSSSNIILICQRNSLRPFFLPLLPTESHLSLGLSDLSLSLSPRSLQALDYCYDPRNLGPNSSKLLPHKPCTSTTYIHTYIHTLSSVLLLSGFNDPSTVGDQTVKKERKGKERKETKQPTQPTHHTQTLDYEKKPQKMQKKDASKRQKEMRKMRIDFFPRKGRKKPRKRKKKIHPQPYLFFFFFFFLLLLQDYFFFFFSIAHNWVPDSCVG